METFIDGSITATALATGPGDSGPPNLVHDGQNSANTGKSAGTLALYCCAVGGSS